MSDTKYRDYLIVVVKKAEWEGDRGNMSHVPCCPWCSASKGDRHKHNCPAFFHDGVVRLEAP